MASKKPKFRSIKQQYHTFVTAQGCHLYRCLPAEAVATLRYFEVVAVVHDYQSEAGPIMKKQSFWYLAVADDSFYLAERTGKSPTVVNIKLRDILSVSNEDHDGMLSSEQLNFNSMKIYVTHKMQWKQQPEEGKPEGGGGGIFGRFRKKQPAPASELLHEIPLDQDGDEGAVNDSWKILADPEAKLVENTLGIVTLGAASNLFFHMKRAWLGARMRHIYRDSFQWAHTTGYSGPRGPQSNLRRISLTIRSQEIPPEALMSASVEPNLNSSGMASSMSSRRMLQRSASIQKMGRSSGSTVAFLNRDSVVVTREVFRDLEDSILNSWCTVWEDEDTEAIEEMTAYTEQAALIKNMFFDHEEILVYYTRSIRILSQINNLPPYHAGPDHDRRESHDMWGIPRWRDSSSGDGGGVNSPGSTDYGDGQISPGGGYYGSARSAEKARRTRQRTEQEERRVEFWGRLAFKLRRRRAWRKALVLVEWLAAMLEHSEGVRERLRWTDYMQGGRLALEQILISLLELEPPEKPVVRGRTPMTKRVRGQDDYRPDYDDDFLDHMASILYDLDGLAEQAFNNTTQDHGSGNPVYTSYLIATSVAKVDPEHLRPKLRSMFLRVMNLMLSPERALDGVRAYRMAFSLTLILRGVPSCADYIREEFEEELKYVLQDPRVYEYNTGTKDSEFFLQLTRPLTCEIISMCLERTPGAQRALYHELLQRAVDGERLGGYDHMEAGGPSEQ